MNLGGQVPQMPELAQEFKQLVEPTLDAPAYGLLTKNDLVFVGKNNLFDAGWLSHCACKILPMHLSKEPMICQTWHEANSSVQSRWASSVCDCPEFLVLEENYLAVDNEVYVQAKVPMVIRWREKLVAVYFFFAHDLQGSGIVLKKRDILEVSVGMLLINADVAIIIYDNDEGCAIHAIGRVPSTFTAIQRKCRWMRDCLLLQKIPPCHCHQNQLKTKGKS